MLKKFINKVGASALIKLHTLLEESVEYFKRVNDDRYAKNQIRKGVVLNDEVLFEGDCQIESESVFIGKVYVGSYSLIGFRNMLWGEEKGITIGRYCQLAPYVTIYAKNHSLHTLTAYNNRRLFDRRLKELDEYGLVKIGSDVWIGKGATILSGVKIGSGVIIGAESVVTKDIPDYAVAVGNPAKVIKRRFSDELIDLLLKWQWWNLSPSELLPYQKLFFLQLPENEAKMIQIISEIIQKR